MRRRQPDRIGRPGQLAVGQIEAEPPPGTEDRRPLDHVLQLADIPRPGVAAEAPDIALREPRLRDVEAARRRREQMLGDRRDVLGTLAQGSRLDREDIETEVEVLAEAPARHLGAQVAIGGGHHPHVDRTGARLADPLEGALLQHAQQLALQVQGNLADFVEEQCAAIGELEPADTVAECAREAALGVAEELALEQVARNRRAVHADHRAGAAAARLVDRAGDQLLPGAGLAGDQHGGVGTGHQLDLPERRRDGRRAADDALVMALGPDFLLQVRVLQLQALPQRVDLGERALQPALVLPPLADVAEHDHGAQQAAAVADRRRGVLDGKGRSVRPPEDLVIDLTHSAVPEGRVDRAVPVRIGAAVRVRVVHGDVHVLADEVDGRPAEHPLGGRVDEGGHALGVDAVDPLPGCPKDQLVAVLDIAEDPLHALPLGKTRAHVGLGLAVDLPAMDSVGIRESHEEERRPARKREGRRLDPQVAARGVARRERARPPMPFRQDGLGEDREGGELPGIERAGPRATQCLTRMAEQPYRRRIGVCDPVLLRRKNQHRIRAGLEDGAEWARLTGLTRSRHPFTISRFRRDVVNPRGAANIL